jgi:hypothetical protein
MANQTKDRTLCDKTISSHVIATNVFFFNGITTGIAHPPTKKAKVTVEYKCGTRVTTSKCTDVRVSVSGSYCLMCYRKQPDYSIECKGEEEDTKQKICYGMSNLQGAYLQRVLERGVR